LASLRWRAGVLSLGKSEHARKRIGAKATRGFVLVVVVLVLESGRAE
jgi:hypothetical protein